jgi:protein O-mannosyl-transferase
MRRGPQKNRPPDHDHPAPLPAEPNTRTRDSRAATAVCLFLLLAVMLVFGQTVWHGFVNVDDQDYVFQNSEVKDGLTLHGIRWAFTTGEAANWHPLTWLSHMLDCQIYGPHASLDLDGAHAAQNHKQDCESFARYAWGHHLTSVLLHAANAILLFLVFWRMTGALWPSAFVAAVFALHPLRAESVAWVAERKDVLSGLFFMLTLAAYVGYVRRSFSLVRYLAVVVLFALGLMAKPMLVTLPFVLLLLDYWPLGRMSRSGGTDIGFWFPRSAWEPTYRDTPCPAERSHAERGNEGGPQQSWLRLIVEKLPLLVLSAASCAVTLWAQRNAIVSSERIDFPSRIANAVASCGDYLVQLFYPVNLAPMYPHLGSALPVWHLAAASLALVAICAAVLIGWRRYPYLPVGWLWYLGMLVPVIGLVQVGSQAMADRYTYLPQIGLCVALTWLAAGLVASWPRHRLLCGGVAALVLLDLMFCAWQQTWYWHDNRTLWTHTLNCTTRNEVAHYGLACALSELGQEDDAIAEFENALTIRPNFAEARFNLGLTLERRKKIDAALEQYREAVKSRPDLAEAHYNLGAIFADRGQTDEAVAEFRKTLDTKPDDANACYNLAVCLCNQGKTAEAMPYWRKTLRLQPNNVDTVDQVAWRLATCPDASIRNGKEALDLAQRAVRLSGGDDPTPLGTLAAAYAEVGQYSEAVETAQRAIELAARRGDAATAGDFRAQIKFYRANSPYHEPPGQPR